MKSSEINSLLSTDISTLAFKDIIAADVKVYSKLLTKKGSTIPLNFTDDQNVALDRSKFLNLLKYTIDGQLSNIELAYICDCLTLVDEIACSDVDVINIIHDLADPEINGGFRTTAQLKQIMSALLEQ